MDDTQITYFESGEGESYGTLDYLLAITLYKGMRITIHRDGVEGLRVLDWYFTDNQTRKQGSTSSSRSEPEPGPVTLAEALWP